MRTKIMFDSDSFDRMNEDINKLKKAKDKLEYYITGIQVRELAEISDERKQIRIRNIMNLCDINAKLVATPFTFDYIDFGHLSFQSSSIYTELLNSNKSNKKDALIGATAAMEGCVLVTEDVRLQKKMKNRDLEVISYNEFVKKYLD